MAAEEGKNFPKQARLRKRSEFLNLSRWGKKSHTPNFVIITRPNEQSETRLGFTVSSKIGNAVIRNRVKRLLRESLRPCRRQITPAKDILIIARKGAADLSFSQVESELKRALLNAVSR